MKDEIILAIMMTASVMFAIVIMLKLELAYVSV